MYVIAVRKLQNWIFTIVFLYSGILEKIAYFIMRGAIMWKW